MNEQVNDSKMYVRARKKNWWFFHFVVYKYMKWHREMLLHVAIIKWISILIDNSCTNIISKLKATPSFRFIVWLWLSLCVIDTLARSLSRSLGLCVCFGGNGCRCEAMTVSHCAYSSEMLQSAKINVSRNEKYWFKMAIQWLPLFTCFQRKAQ